MTRKALKLRDFPPSVRKLVEERSGGICECGCGRAATDHHHRRLRGRPGPGETHGPANDAHLSHECHMRFHNEGQAWAKVHGFIVASGADPQLVNVTRMDGREERFDAEGLKFLCGM